MTVGKGSLGFVACPCTHERRCEVPPRVVAHTDTQHVCLQSVVEGSCVMAETVVHSIRGITAHTGLMGSRRRVARRSKPTFQLPVRPPEPRVAPKESVP
jgi:hypothetical protein